MSNVGTIPVEEILPEYRHTGERDYVGRHRVEDTTISSRIAATWRAVDSAAYAKLPATWRHRLETCARHNADRSRRNADTETWWISRKADYPVLVDTQTMPTLTRRRETAAA